MMDQENDGAFQVQGKTYAAAGPGSVDIALDHRVTGDYFQTMGIPLLTGRYFSAQDAAGSAPVVVVSEPFAQRYFPGQDPVGKRLMSEEEGGKVSREIVGVVGGVHFHALEHEIWAEMYFPYSQHVYSTMTMVVRTKQNAADIGTALRTAVASIDPNQPISAIRSMDDVVAASASQPKFYSLLLGLFAIVALALSAIGLYGVISYAASQHTREIGIRLALGASSTDIARQVAGQGLRLTGLGLAAGLAGAWFASRLLANYLFDVMPHDADTFLFLPPALAAVALAACWIPVRRAMRVDPSVSLREP
jgi:predicted permease